MKNKEEDPVVRKSFLILGYTIFGITITGASGFKTGLDLIFGFLFIIIGSLLIVLHTK